MGRDGGVRLEIAGVSEMKDDACSLDVCLWHEAFWSSKVLRQLDFSTWVRSHPLLLLVFSPKLEEERMGMGASQKVISTWVCLVLMVLTDMLDIFHDAGLGYWYLVSSGL
ncbi:hypothetical protein L3X38_018562 [Prunus dulcis]|uniref:Uncharacterized protein n=1 Tax=Prunus dulcis TaxID=3755 RepID=A0AAD4W9A0_PRUDU|nr:hypothetical protein L3X38_018562 [Prunus dulcis]